MAAGRTLWTEGNIANVCDAEFAARTYLEQRDVRSYLTVIASNLHLRHVCDVGAGYDRLSVIRREFCDHVVAFEREPALVAKGSYLHPTIEFRHVDSLGSLMAQDEEFSMALSFTVLQHLTDSLAENVLRELERIVSPGGYVLLCEESNDQFLAGDPAEQDSRFTIGRSIECYSEWLSSLRLVDLSPRCLERRPVGRELGMYMLFRKSPK